MAAAQLPRKRTRVEAAESVFEFLHTELVHYFAAQVGGKDQNGDAALAKLESLGYTVGWRFAERNTVDRPRFVETEPLEIVKFICKELWTDLFAKQVDKLQTNFKGTYVLQDRSFRWFQRLSSGELSESELKHQASFQAAFTCGVIRGALFNLGMKATVKADIQAIPTCHFTVVDIKGTAAATQGGGPGPMV